MIVDGGRLEAFAAVLTGIGSYTCVRTHVKCQAVGYAKGLAANLPTNKVNIATANEANEEAKIHIRLQLFHIESFACQELRCKRRYDNT